uniref:OCEL domain-containing protein n=1 Tax=Setaria digitata TaxID=48799 RepID=A0A915PR47_9BILA
MESVSVRSKNAREKCSEGGQGGSSMLQTSDDDDNHSSDSIPDTMTLIRIDILLEYATLQIFLSCTTRTGERIDVMAGAGSPRSSSPSNSSLEVLRMQVDTTSMSRQSAMMIKLTDESIAALKVAQKSRQPVRLKIDKQGGTIEIGSNGQTNKFRFVVQEVPGAPADAVSYDSQKRYRTVATFHSKIQANILFYLFDFSVMSRDVQTTAKALAETRDKLIEEEKKKLKDSSRHKREQRSVTVKRATNPLAIGAQRPSSSSSARSYHSDSSNKNTASRNLSTHQQQISSNSSAAGARSFVRAELSRRPLRKRVIHLVILGRFSSASEIIAQLRRDSLNEEIAQEDADRVQEIVDEIVELNRETGRLQLKQTFYNEVDARWPGFSSDEKSYVRKILSGSMGNHISNFAPVRKSRIVPMVAPASGTIHSNAQPLTDDLSFRSVQSKSPESTASSVGSKSPSEIISSVNNAEMNVLNSKRKAHANQVIASSQIGSKRPRQQSLSPPEDPSNANLAAHPQQAKSTTQRPVGLNDSERPAEPVSSTNSGVSLSSTSQSNRDWLKEFPEPRSLEEAEIYYLKFLDDYPKYLTCYNLLSAVVNEFKELEKKMNEAPKNSKEHEKAEEAIEMRYMHYQRNPEYLETRQKHEDLRSKLEILKKHVDFWEKNQRRQVTTDRTSSNNSGNNSNHHALKNASTL